MITFPISHAFACSVCFGSLAHPETLGIKSGIILILILIGILLAVIGLIGFIWHKRSKRRPLPPEFGSDY